MSLQEQQNLLAKLYTDAEFRRVFLSEPEKHGAENGLDEKELAELAGIMPEELNFFADSLFWKRLREVEKFLPLSKKALGDEFTRLFREFSRTFNPPTIKKHFEDARGFSKFLQTRRLEPLWAIDLAKYEYSRLIFNSAAKKIVFARFNHFIPEIIREITAGNVKPQKKFRRKNSFAVWLKLGKRTRHFVR